MNDTLKRTLEALRICGQRSTFARRYGRLIRENLSKIEGYLHANFGIATNAAASNDKSPLNVLGTPLDFSSRILSLEEKANPLTNSAQSMLWRAVDADASRPGFPPSQPISFPLSDGVSPSTEESQNGSTTEHLQSDQPFLYSENGGVLSYGK
jgi:hypothetical protein